MTRKFKPVSALFSAWENNPAFVAEYDALEEEFALAAALIEARGRAGLTQEEVATRMGTTQTAIARLEGGGPCRQRERCNASRPPPARNFASASRHTGR